MSAEIVFLWPGRTRAGYAREGVEEYLARIRRFLPCRVLEIAAERQDGRYSSAHRVEREGRRLLARLDAFRRARVVVLDPRGRQLDSASFARWLGREVLDSGERAVFVVGGPDGLSSLVRDRAHLLLGFTRMTLPHDLARVLLGEQVYRALTILRGHPYDR